MNAALKVSRDYGDSMPKDMLALADHAETETFTRPITEEERTILSSGVTELSIREEDVTTFFSSVTSGYNATLKGIKLEKKGNLRALRTGRTEVEETVFTFLDHDAGKTHKYDMEGNRIATRRMTPTEAQLVIK